MYHDISLQVSEDFEEEDFHAPIPFGRPAGFGFGSSGSGFGSFGGSGGGQESPTSTTNSFAPTGFGHARNDSVTSEESTGSARAASRPKQVFGHSSQTSVAAPTTPAPTKKSSFASIRNAFKSGSSKTQDLPPLPPLDHSSYPALKNPFNRSNSSLAHVPSSSRSRPQDGMSPPQARPATPGSTDFRSARQTPRAKGHAPVRSGHSYTGSLHYSDAGSDYGSRMQVGSAEPARPGHRFGRALAAAVPGELARAREARAPRKLLSSPLHPLVWRLTFLFAYSRTVFGYTTSVFSILPSLLPPTPYHDGRRRKF